MYLYAHMYVLMCVYTYTYRPSCMQHECNACAHAHIVPLSNTRTCMHARAHTHAYRSHPLSCSYSFSLAPSFFLCTLSLPCSVSLVFSPSLARVHARALSLPLSVSLSFSCTHVLSFSFSFLQVGYQSAGRSSGQAIFSSMALHVI